MAQDGRSPTDGDKLSFARTFRETNVFKSERRAILRRRKAVQDSMKVSKDEAEAAPLDKKLLDPQELAADESLVGLSLSGGGMRSASFCIGFLQKLGGSGLLRYVDYMSTVSGGGYAGAVLSANAYARGQKQGRRSREGLKKTICPFEPEELTSDDKKDKAEGQASKLIQRLVYGGDYLFRDKFAFAARYCAGLLLNNIFILSGVIVVAAALAILWRGLDAPLAWQKLAALDAFSLDSVADGDPWREQAKWYLAWLPKQLSSYFGFQWQDDATRPFIPLLCCVTFWLFAVLLQMLWWNGDYFIRRAMPGRRNPLAGTRDRRATDATLNALCWGIGIIAMALSYNHDWLTTLGVFSQDTSRHWDTAPLRVAIAAFLCFVALGPLRKWIHFGIERFHQVVLALIVLSLLIGLAVLMGNRDLSNASSPWQNSLVPWGTLATLLLPFLKPNLVIQSATQPTNPAQRAVFVLASTALLLGGPLFCVFWIAREDFSQIAETRTNVYPYDFMTLPEADGGFAGFRKQLLSDVNGFRKQLGEELIPERRRLDEMYGANSLKTQRVAAQTPLASRPADPLSIFNVKLAGQLRAVTEDFSPNKVKDLGKAEGLVTWNDALENLNVYLGYCKSLETRLDRDTIATMPIAMFVNITDFDPTTFLKTVEGRFAAQKSAWSMMSEARSQRFDMYFDEFKKTELRTLLDLRMRLAEELAKNSSNYPLAVEDQIRKANRLLLSAWYPGFIRTRGFISTNVVIEPDQDSRAWLLFGALCTFIVAGLLIDPNRTSIQQFYRQQLSKAFVTSEHMANIEDVELQNINTTAYGAPYHLLSGTVNYMGLCAPETAHRQEMFLFSRKFCGSRQLQYARTGRLLPRAYNSLGNVVAVSGAALSPTTASQPLLFAVMMVLNLRLGQWLPNPRRLVSRFLDGRWKSVPRLLPVIYAMTKEASERSLCFVTDGGHRENLGVMQLLLRRCRLIIAVDAGQDPAHRFDDLARVLRSAEVHLGTKFYELDAEGRFTGRMLQSDELDLRNASHEARLRRRNKNADEMQETRETTAREEKSLVGQHYLLARIVYPEQAQVDNEERFNAPEEFNLLVYVKPSLTGDEAELIEQYRAQNPDFPHESTLQQDYSPAQFEAYRELGLHIGEEIARRFAPVTAEANWWARHDTVEVGDLIDAFLERQWFLKKSSRLENDYAPVLIKWINNLKLKSREYSPAEFAKCLEYARVLRRLHGQACVMEGVRELAEVLKVPGCDDCQRLLIELGPLAVLPVLALFRCAHIDVATRERCLAVLAEVMLTGGKITPDAAEFLPRVVRELERFLIRGNDRDLRAGIEQLLARLAVAQSAAEPVANAAPASQQRQEHEDVEAADYRGMSDSESHNYEDETEFDRVDKKPGVFTFYVGSVTVEICAGVPNLRAMLKSKKDVYKTRDDRPVESYRFEILATRDLAKDREKELLSEYVRCFGDVPPYNRV